MPIENIIDHEQKFIRTICTGQMLPADFDDYINRVWRTPDHYGYDELFDAREADWDGFDFGYLFEIAKAAATLTAIDTDSKLAWLILEGKQKELTDFYKSAKSLMPVPSRALQAFYSLDEAMLWIKS